MKIVLGTPGVNCDCGALYRGAEVQGWQIEVQRSDLGKQSNWLLQVLRLSIESF